MHTAGLGLEGCRQRGLVLLKGDVVAQKARAGEELDLVVQSRGDEGEGRQWGGRQGSPCGAPPYLGDKVQVVLSHLRGETKVQRLKDGAGTYPRSSTGPIVSRLLYFQEAQPLHAPAAPAGERQGRCCPSPSRRSCDTRPSPARTAPRRSPPPHRPPTCTGRGTSQPGRGNGRPSRSRPSRPRPSLLRGPRSLTRR